MVNLDLVCRAKSKFCGLRLTFQLLGVFMRKTRKGIELFSLLIEVFQLCEEGLSIINKIDLFTSTEMRVLVLEDTCRCKQQLECY